MGTRIARNRLEERLHEALARSPVVAVLGARQVGKTQLVKHLDVPADNFFDLERPRDALRLDADSYGVLNSLRGIVVIDEVQRIPELFPVLRVLADREDQSAQFVITGSVAPETIRGVSESLAGRTALLPMGGLTLDEIEGFGEPAFESWRRLWLQGSMPRSFLQEEKASIQERDDYLQLLINRDFREWGGKSLSPVELWRLLVLTADSSGQAWNHRGAGSALQITNKAVMAAMDVLLGAFLIRELPPFANTARKRLRKTPKLVIRDVGLMHALLGISSQRELEIHHRYGASWETFCIEQVIRMTETRDERCFSWTIDSGPEVDLILDRTDGRFGFEFKAGGTPKLTNSMKLGVKEMGLDRLFVVHPGDIRYPMQPSSGLPIEAVGIEKLAEVCREIRG